ncbi:hypothetical protein QR680_015611 [Steinernema hermaphroditum]|uniref:G-protein coupled receptors family 1 profile domain-containing protein n=1 Tax=Steinernema hermaphroditum TaxID=289476 RepID=A0AA39HAA8_9BILA|nr:hypothetical protein QR680_015611 [Steinernema hermaphroditum]
MYLILFKSPKRLQTYKYILLNIAIWVFAYEIVQNVIALPMPIIEILGFYAEGLAKALSPEGGFACFVGIVFCIGQYIVALLFAFFYRYRALKIDFGVCGVNPTKWHYRLMRSLAVQTAAPVVLFVVPLSLVMVIKYADKSCLHPATELQHIPGSFSNINLNLSTLHSGCSLAML